MIAEGGFTVAEPIYNQNITLSQGWNLMGTGPSLLTDEISDNIASNPYIEYVYSYESGQYYYWIKGLPENMQTLTTLRPNKGYWIRAEQETQITLQYTTQ